MKTQNEIQFKEIVKHPNIVHVSEISNQNQALDMNCKDSQVIAFCKSNFTSIPNSNTALIRFC